MRKNSFAIAARGFHRDSLGVSPTGTARARVRPSRGGPRVPLRLTWRCNPATGRVEGSWGAVPAKQGAQRATPSVASPIVTYGAQVDAA